MIINNYFFVMLCVLMQRVVKAYYLKQCGLQLYELREPSLVFSLQKEVAMHIMGQLNGQQCKPLHQLNLV